MANRQPFDSRSRNEFSSPGVPEYSIKRKAYAAVVCEINQPFSRLGCRVQWVGNGGSVVVYLVYW